MTKSRAILWGLFLLLAVRVAAMIWVPLTDPTEARYAEIARKMVETGNWITPQFDYGVPFWAKPPLHTWLSAAIAGLLVHVIFHHDHRRRGGRTAWVSALDLLGAAVGVALPLLAASQGSEHGGDRVRIAVGEAFGELLLETAPMLLLGLAVGALLQRWGSRIPSRYYRGGGSWAQALRGIVVGAPLPLCACGVLPIAESLRKRGAGPALVMAFLVTTPELGPETLTLTVRFLGWPFAVLRLAAALLLALLVAVIFARLAHSAPDRPEPPDPGESMATGGDTGRPLVQIAGAFDELLRHIAPWTFVGLLAAAFVEVMLGEGSLASLAERGLDLFVVALVAMPSYVCPASATPLAAVLVTKGVSSGAVLVGLLLGPATNLATIGVLRRGYGTRAVGLCVLITLGLSIAMGLVVNLVGVEATVPARMGQEHGHGMLAIGSVVVLGAVLLGQLWRHGTRPWLEILEGSHEHDHEHHHHGHHHHDHDHGHEHHHH